MKFSIIGYGKMGKEVEKMATERGHQLVMIFDIDNLENLTTENLQKADVVFEFTKPDAAFSNVMKCFDASVACVCGTTGWNEHLHKVIERCKTEQKTLFWSPNFSIGMNIMFAINEYLAKIMNKFDNYDVSISEIHHIHKLDAPSGTAVSLANQILKHIERKKEWQLHRHHQHDKHSEIEFQKYVHDNPSVLRVEAIRQGEVFGIHNVIYESDYDSIQINHSAKNRRGLALGAVLAAEFVLGKKGYFTMQNLLNLQ